MQVKLAKSAGFCFGVERAVKLVNENIETVTDKPIYTYGPIIHNDTVVKELESRGVTVISEDDDLSNYKPGVIIIRSHGVTKAVEDELRGLGFEIVDATCPFVKKIHRIVAEHAKCNEHILVIGNKNHPEVQGIIGWIGNDDYSVISNEEEARAFSLDKDRKICIVSQTTFNHNKFQELVEIIGEVGYDKVCENTICNATFERQSEAKDIASKSDVMFVIGDAKSSNSQKLFEICKAECNDTYFIQTVDDLDLHVLQSQETVGITAGASTPNNIIEEVQKKCQK